MEKRREHSIFTKKTAEYRKVRIGRKERPTIEIDVDASDFEEDTVTTFAGDFDNES